MFASKLTRVEIPSKSVPTLRKDLRFSASSHSIHEKAFPAKYHKVGKGLEKVVHSASKTKKKFEQKLFYEALFSSSYELSYSKTAVFWRFRFYIPNIVRVWKLGWWKKFSCVVSEANCCFILMGDFFDETEMYDTNNKRSFHLSES